MKQFKIIGVFHIFHRVYCGKLRFHSAVFDTKAKRRRKIYAQKNKNPVKTAEDESNSAEFHGNVL